MYQLLQLVNERNAKFSVQRLNWCTHLQKKLAC